eukprot:Rhum_TRINITY_DN3170_c0_g2::Rhum_TRINITY_DN3170_c0_g2_i1::g.9696::m.9696/K04507/CACYBP, SIP; calcyclin binding protein
MPVSADDLRSERLVLADDIEELRKLQSLATRGGVHKVLRDALAAAERRAAEIDAVLATPAAPAAPVAAPPAAAATPEAATPPLAPPPLPDGVRGSGPPPQDPLSAGATAAASEAEAEAAAQQPVQPDGFGSFAALSRYSWDQTDRFVKVYCDLPHLKDAAGEVRCRFGLYSFAFWAEGVPTSGGRTESFRLAIPNLCEKVSLAGSSLLRKDEKFVVRLAKLQRGVTWTGLDDSEKKKTEAHQALVSKGATTSELLASMYENADESQRESLSKAAWEGHKKRQADAKAKGFEA